MSRCRGSQVGLSTDTATGDLFAGTYYGEGVFRSTDNGETWSEKNNGLIGDWCRRHSGIAMFRSTDGGQGWEKVNNGLSALYESCLAINAMVTFFSGPILWIELEESFGWQTTGRAGLRSIIMWSKPMFAR